MARPLDYMPRCSLSQVESLLSSLYYSYHSISEISLAGEYHQIWRFEAVVDDTSLPAVLRISGSHIPRLKTENEVAILNWLSSETSTVSVPRILASDSSIDNPLDHEYIILECLPGVPGLSIHDKIPDDKMDAILKQLAEMHIELFQRPFLHCGGLRLDATRAIVPGPCVSEKLWYESDIRWYWPASESYESLNPSSSDGYPTYAEWIAAHMDCYIHGIKVYQSLGWITKPEVELLESFVWQLREPDIVKSLGNVPFRLAHQDLHFGQLMIDPESYELTGVIDWEFRQVVPLPLWKKSFLWVGSSTKAQEKTKKMYERWEEMVKAMDGGTELLIASQWPTEDHETVWDACNYLRCVVEVCPREQQLEEAKEWWNEVLKAIADFNETEED